MSEETKKVKPVCSHCKSDMVTTDANAVWNEKLQEWELSSTHDDTWCGCCGGECGIDWVPTHGEVTLGSNVVAPDPVEEDLHHHSFTGRVCYIREQEYTDNLAIVVDGDENRFEIEISRLRLEKD